MSQQGKELEKLDEDFDKRWILLSLLLSLFFAIVSGWKIYEGDVFWLCRAGEEILTQHSIQTVDTWSSTALGHPWYNFQWLSSVLFYSVSAMHSGYLYLPILRSFLVFLVLLPVFGIIKKQCSTSTHTGYCAALLIPIFYLVNFGRFQLRPDLFGILLFSFGTLLLINPKVKNSFAIQLLILLLWANFHGGTFPIGLTFFALSWLFKPRGILKICVGTLCWFITPIHFHVLSAVKAISFDYDWTLIMNPDHFPLSWELLNPYKYGGTFLLWVILAPMALFAAYRNKERNFWLLTLLILDALTIGRARARPYSMLAALPMLVLFFDEILQSRWGKITLAVGSAICWFALLPLHLISAPTLGLGLNESAFPVQTARFLNDFRPAGRLLNHYDFGGYLIDQARAYPVAQDGRETIYSDFFKEKQRASQTPQTFADFLNRNHFDVLITQSPKSGSEQERENWYPKFTWAEVASDSASILYLRRTPENLAIIGRKEIQKHD